MTRGRAHLRNHPEREVRIFLASLVATILASVALVTYFIATQH
jgi:hypothetical protein